MSKKKLIFDEEATESIRNQFGTGAFVFRNENGSRVILNRIGEDHWSHLVGGYNPGGSPPTDDEDQEEPEDDDEPKKDKKKRPPKKKTKKRTIGGADDIPGNTGGGGGSGSPTANPDNTSPGTNTVDEDYYRKLQKQIDKMERTGQDVNPPPKNNKDSDNPIDDNFNRKQKNIYEAMRDELDKQIRGFYKNGKFTISPEKMMNEVFSKIMEKYGYKTYAGKGFKSAIDGVKYVKSTINKIKSETLTKIKEKIAGKITNKNIRTLLGLDGNKGGRITRTGDLGKIIKMIRSNPLNFILKAFMKGTEASDTFGALLEAVGGEGAADVMSYVMTLLIF